MPRSQSDCQSRVWHAALVALDGLRMGDAVRVHEKKPAAGGPCFARGRHLLWKESREDLAHLLPTLQDWQAGRIIAPPKLEGDLEQLAFAPEVLEQEVGRLRQ